MNNLNKKAILIVGGFILAIVIIVLLILTRESKTKTAATDVVPTIVPTTRFLVKSTIPANNATDIFPGEIQISFTTDVPINSVKDFSFYLSPAPDVTPKLTSSFPTSTITYQVLGGLKKNTQYTVFVNNKHSQNAAVWSFKTSSAQPESSSAQANEEQKQLNDSYYPLFDFVPFENKDFQIDYAGRLSLLIKIKKNNIEAIKKNNIEAIKKEALDWIKSKGVNPSTHTINYQNTF